MPHARASRGSGSGAGPAVSHRPDTSRREALGATLGAPGHTDGRGLIGPSTATALPWGCPCHPRTSRDLRRGRAPRRSRPCGQGQGCPAGPVEAQTAGLRVFTPADPSGGQPGPLLPQRPQAPDGEWGSRPCSEPVAQTRTPSREQRPLWTSEGWPVLSRAGRPHGWEPVPTLPLRAHRPPGPQWTSPSGTGGICQSHGARAGVGPAGQ